MIVARPKKIWYTTPPLHAFWFFLARSPVDTPGMSLGWTSPEGTSNATPFGSRGTSVYKAAHYRGSAPPSRPSKIFSISGRRRGLLCCPATSGAWPRVASSARTMPIYSAPCLPHRGVQPGEGPLAQGCKWGLNVGVEFGMFSPGVCHHQGASPRSVYWRFALNDIKKALQGAKPVLTLQTDRAREWINVEESNSSFPLPRPWGCVPPAYDELANR